MNEHTSQCARCGSCSVVCPVYQVTGRESLTARGKLQLLGSELARLPTADFRDIFAQCLLCGACEAVCPRHLPIMQQIVAARARFPTPYGRHGLPKSLVLQILARPRLLAGLVKAGLTMHKINLLPAWSGLRLRLGLLAGHYPEAAGMVSSSSGFDSLKKDQLLYFTGCLARYLQPAISSATVQLAEQLAKNSVLMPAKQVCCGLAAFSAGRLDEARALAQANIEAFGGSAGPILTSCASCYAHLQHYPELLSADTQWHEKAMHFRERVREFGDFFLPYGENHGPTARFAVRRETKLFYHNPCHLRFRGSSQPGLGQLLSGIDRIIAVNSPADARCCGHGGLFQLGYPGVADHIFQACYEAAFKHEPELIVTSCSGCLLQWQWGLANRHNCVPARHPAVVLTDSLVHP